MSNRGRLKKTGLPPGSAVYTGSRSGDPIRISVIDFCDARCENVGVVSVDQLASYRGVASTTWVDVDGVHDAELVQQVCEIFAIHALAIEDILSIGTRPKFEEYDDSLFIVLHMLETDPQPLHSGHRSGQAIKVGIEQVSVVIGRGFVLTFQERPGDVWDPVRKRIHTSGSRFRKSGSDYLGYALLDAVVDHYFHVLETIGDEVENLEGKALDAGDSGVVVGVHSLKRTLLRIRRAVWPLREVTGALMRSEHQGLVQAATQPFLRDLHDHVVQAVETAEIYRESAITLLDIYLAGTSNRMNEVMKVLTVNAAIFIPITFISSVYGMNFQFMPELHWKYGYFIAAGVMASTALVMVVYFKRKKWM